jgi:hypothetical protein
VANFTNHSALQTLQWVLAQGTPAAPAALWVQLHVGDPGPEGDQNIALNSTRVQITYGAAVNTGSDGRAQAASDANVGWASVPEDETYSHISLWDAETAGNCWYFDAMLAPVPVTTGGAFVFPIGQTIDHV